MYINLYTGELFVEADRIVVNPTTQQLLFACKIMVLQKCVLDLYEFKRIH